MQLHGWVGDITSKSWNLAGIRVYTYAWEPGRKAFCLLFSFV